tara:strand:+ start:386 stop:1225 length:840 start_codon:yes stop_codon:yes gene_type:complete
MNDYSPSDEIAVPNKEELKGFLDKSIQIADETRHLVDQFLIKGFRHNLKPDSSFVTDVDFAIEEKIRSKLALWYPSHSIVGEELPSHRSESDYEWIIDPIDGTHSFLHKIPLYGTLLALRYKGNLVLGVIDLPGIRRRYSGALGLGTWCNNTKLVVNDIDDSKMIEHEIISVGNRSQFSKSGKINVLDRLVKSHSSVRSYCDCFGHGLALQGSVGAVLDPDLHLWDIAATVVLAKEAGCKFVWLKREDESRKGGCYDVVFGKEKVVDWLVNLWNEVELN